jgi:SAM-dependent methyltransferase
MHEKTPPKRQLGSADEFEAQWHSALTNELKRWVAYPNDPPSTQIELDELVKAGQLSRLLETCGIKNGLVLEYGCGTAGMSLYLANHGFRTIGCDVSPSALQLARLNARRHLVPGAEARFQPVAGDVFHLPFEAGAFDVVMSYGLLEHLAPTALPDALAETLRTLRPGGLFIADIVHARFSVRTIGKWVNLAVSTVAHVLTLRWNKVRPMWSAYLDPFYENDLDSDAWANMLRSAGFCAVHVDICRPFAPLAVSGRLERLYVGILRRLRPFWDWFDQSQPKWGRRWGWLYLVWGTKPGSPQSAE